jgi:hypothetical protein
MCPANTASLVCCDDGCALWIEGVAKNDGKFALIRTRAGVDVWAEILTTDQMLHLINNGIEISWTAEPAPFSRLPYRIV